MKMDEQTFMPGNIQRNVNTNVRTESNDVTCGMNSWKKETSRTKGY
jgi:hypothetical protein